jgi:hypothetical protein
LQDVEEEEEVDESKEENKIEEIDDEDKPKEKKTKKVKEVRRVCSNSLPFFRQSLTRSSFFSDHHRERGAQQDQASLDPKPPGGHPRGVLVVLQVSL